ELLDTLPPGDSGLLAPVAQAESRLTAATAPRSPAATEWRVPITSRTLARAVRFRRPGVGPRRRPGRRHSTRVVRPELPAAHGVEAQLGPVAVGQRAEGAGDLV